ncbi:ABC transporter substrate-binding protein [Alteribacillus sp. HJP-4]|uniref:ABC transporter substrate-binding protein n=1 Tax=Alteribacillus sp. HJP-4 TaxID=2775394 RepID=UPI0035CD0B41
MLRRKNPFLSALFLLLILIMTACSGGGGEGEETSADNDSGGSDSNEDVVELDFWTFWGSEVRRPIVEQIVEDFNSSQDEIQVNHLFVPFDDIWTKSLAQISAGDPPDVLVNDIRTTQQRADKNQVENLSEFVDSDMENRFYPDLWNTVLHEDEPYAIPFNTDTRILFYNKDAFKEAGLDPDQPPETWEELEEYAQQLDIQNGDRYERIGYYPLWGSVGYDLWLGNADGGTAFIDENGEPAINSSEKVEALEWVKGWQDRYGKRTIEEFSANFGGEGANPFISGQVAMYSDVATFYTNIRDFGEGMNIGVAAMPEKEEGNGHWSVGGGFVLEVPHGAENPEASYEFIKFATDHETQKYWATENFDNVANIEASEAAVEELEGGEKETYQTSVEALEETMFFTAPFELPDYEDYIIPNIDEAMLDNMTPQEALDQSQEEVEQRLNE